ncbi:MAG: macro domain-containing protein [Acidimicrobiales bacterium]|nr:macro domain-containing protein [Acidimicrobiales bacterium]
MPTRDKVLLGLSLSSLSLVLAAFIFNLNTAARLALIFAGVAGTIGFARNAMPSAMTWLGLTGRVEGRVAHSFIHRSCPKCGRELEHSCKGCGRWLIDADESFCWNCGIKYWWAVLHEESGKERLDEWKSSSHKLIDAGSTRTVWTLVCSITQVPVDAVVSTDTADGAMKGEVAVHLFAMGGSGIEAESMAAVAGRRDVEGDGEARESWITNAGTLPAHHVIHLPLVGRSLSAGEVEKAVLDVLALAAEEGLASVALPLLGTGRGEMTHEVATLEIYRAVLRWQEAPATSVKDIIVIFREEDEAVRFREVVRKADATAKDLDTPSEDPPDLVQSVQAPPGVTTPDS